MYLQQVHFYRVYPYLSLAKGDRTYGTPGNDENRGQSSAIDAIASMSHYSLVAGLRPFLMWLQHTPLVNVVWNSSNVCKEKYPPVIERGNGQASIER